MIVLALMIGLLLLLAMGIIIYATRSKKIILISSAIIIILSLALYFYLGNSQGLRNAQLLQEFNDRAQAGEDLSDVMQALISGLNQQLKLHSDDPITWALLGKIYFTLKDYSEASRAFAKAYTLLPDDPELLIDFATADYLAKEGKLDPELALLLDKVKKLEPTLASLSLLANVAYESGHTAQAIVYWQTMQAEVLPSSELYQELAAMIAMAKNR